MSFDSRLINPDKVIELLKQKIDEKHFSISYTISTTSEDNHEHHVYFFEIYPWGLFVRYCFAYNDSELKSRK